MAARLEELGRWLADRAAADPELPALHEDYCRRLLACGLPIWRSTLGLEGLDPEISGTQLTWTDGALSRREAQRAGILENPDYLHSPMRVVDETDRPYRRRLDTPAADMPLLEELRSQGATDYLIVPLPFLDRTRSAAMSFATRAVGGFTGTETAALELAARLFSPYAERQVLRQIAIDLLDTYVGHGAGRCIHDGNIERGDLATIDAAIWFCDLRGFTRLSDHAPRGDVIAALNDWFDCLDAALAPAGGEILKFLGDGLLAIFPAGEDPAEACRRALAAAASAFAAVDALNARRRAAGQPPLAFGLALHLGEVGFGNVGARRRLDFTVVGPAVNHASRLQELTKVLGCQLLASEAFAAAAGAALLCLGLHRLRDVDQPQAVFTTAWVQAPRMATTATAGPSPDRPAG
jgi:adenylate cyclase